MYTHTQLNHHAMRARQANKPTWRIDFVEQCGCTTNFAVGVESYQEAVCMADTCLANDNPKSVTISREE